MTLRLDPALLDALKRTAKRQGRSVSSEVVRLIRKELEPSAVGKRARRRTMGMFAGLEAPDLIELKRIRRQVSGSVLGGDRRRRRAS